MKKELGSLYGAGNVTVDTTDGETYVISITGKGTYALDSNGNVSDYKQVTIAEKITQTSGDELVDGTTYTEAYVTITILNKEEFENIKSMELYNENTSITPVSIDLNAGTATFKITANRTYKAKVVAKSGDKEVPGSKAVEVKNVITAESFDRYYTEGKIDVVWLDTNNNVIAEPNIPVLTKKDGETAYGLTAVEYDSTQIDCWKNADTSKEWYKYIEQTSKIGDSAQGTSRWANARANDGSLFVWIPRYAYKITYYDTKGNEIGYSTNAGIIDSKGNILDATDSNYAQNEKVKTAGYTDYIVHPAFTKDAANGGGWESELSGLWFGKFEAKNNGSSVQVVAKESSWRSLYINQMYNYGQTATYGGSNSSSNILQSHMVKNSEWGAVAYLAHSQYGLNGGKVMRNASSSYYTGGSNTIATVYGANVYQSTTHNPYGIYDLNGGAYEYVASYVNNGNTNLTSNGNYNSSTLTYSLYGSTDAEKSTSTKFKTVCPSTVSDGSSAQSADYSKNSNMRGDAVYETSKSHSNATGSWYSAYSYFPHASYPFFARGSYYWGDGSGSFCFNIYHGFPYNNYGFRVALVL